MDIKNLISDLIIDYRCAKIDGLNDYAKKVYEQIQLFYKKRHSLESDQYGWPKI